MKNRYCCSENPCSKIGNTVLCKNGTVKKIYERCYGQCPTAKLLVNFVTISSSDVCFKNNETGTCYDYKSSDNENLYAKVCQSSDVFETDQNFVMNHCGGQSEICPTSDGLYQYRQCYSNNIVTRDNTPGHR